MTSQPPPSPPPYGSPAYASADLPDGQDMAQARIDRPTRLRLGCPSEDADLIALVAAWRDTLRLHHSPNEGRLPGDDRARMRAAAKRKAMGLSSGWPDLYVAERVVVGGVVVAPFAVVELKRRDGVRSDLRDDQAAWLLHFRRIGAVAEWCRGFDEADRLLRRLYPARLT
jgi:hypothetical protein